MISSSLLNLSKKVSEEQRSVSPEWVFLWPLKRSAQLAPVTSPWGNTAPLFAMECIENSVPKKGSLASPWPHHCVLFTLWHVYLVVSVINATLDQEFSFGEDHSLNVQSLTHLRNKKVLRNASQKFNFKSETIGLCVFVPVFLVTWIVWEQRNGVTLKILSGIRKWFFLERQIYACLLIDYLRKCIDQWNEVYVC